MIDCARHYYRRIIECQKPRLEVFPKALSILVLPVQYALMALFLYHYKDPSWLIWLIVDVLVLVYWLVIICKPIRSAEENVIRPDPLFYCYATWLIYAVSLIPQIILLFVDTAQKLDRRELLGSGMLKFTLSLFPLLFLLFVYAHHNNYPQSKRRNEYINYLTSEATLDLYDIVEMLENLFADEIKFTVSKTGEILILTFSCCNIVSPVFALIDLRNVLYDLLPSSSGQVSNNRQLRFKTIYVWLSLVLNACYLSLRIWLWYEYRKDISVLFMKNIIVIGLRVVELYRYYCVRESNETERASNITDQDQSGNQMETEIRIIT